MFDPKYLQFKIRALALPTILAMCSCTITWYIPAVPNGSLAELKELLGTITGNERPSRASKSQRKLVIPIKDTNFNKELSSATMLGGSATPLWILI